VLPNRLALTLNDDLRLDVRSFEVSERVSSLFRVTLEAHASDASLDFAQVLGQAAEFRVLTDSGVERSWQGICCQIEQTRAAEGIYCCYRVVLVPALWLTTQRRNYRMFQQLSEPDIVLQVLADWGIEPELRIDTSAYKTRKYRVQYGESDFAFICRMLEDAGITFTFDPNGRLVLSDAPTAREPRSPLPYADQAFDAADRPHATRLRLQQRVRPGRYTVRDHDYRRAADYPLVAEARQGSRVEERLERYHYVPGAFLFGTEQGEGTPNADDRGKTRHDEDEGRLLASRRLQAKRASGFVVEFEANAQTLQPGDVTKIEGYPNQALVDRPLLVLGTAFTGEADRAWRFVVEACDASVGYRPPLQTPKPKVSGVESATVVGPPGEEIHTDEFGRVRVHFHWDRSGQMDHTSSCWIHVSQPWAGTGFGGVNIPRVGQEVIVEFLGGDPDRPVIVGRVFTNLNKAPFDLPASKTQSGMRSASSPGGGGYNELMFEDEKGHELMRVQAEKDRHTLVKNDEEMSIGHDRCVEVGNDEEVMVANNSAHTIGLNDRRVVGVSSVRVVGQNDSVSVGTNQSVQVGASRKVSVGSKDSEKVGLTKSLTVGAAYQVSVVGAMSTTVGLLRTDQVGLVHKITAGVRFEVSCGASKLVLDQDGTITLEGKLVKIIGSDAIHLN
jgi:type VI secretion system secreted protein VgrG